MPVSVRRNPIGHSPTGLSIGHKYSRAAAALHCLGSGEVARQMRDDVARILLGTENEGRLATPQHGQSDRVHTRAADHRTAVVSDLAPDVEDRQLEPAKVGAKSGRPDD